MTSEINIHLVHIQEATDKHEGSKRQINRGPTAKKTG